MDVGLCKTIFAVFNADWDAGDRIVAPPQYNRMIYECLEKVPELSDRITLVDGMPSTLGIVYNLNDAIPSPTDYEVQRSAYRAYRSALTYLDNN